MKNASIVGHRHYAGITQFCTECKRIRKLYGQAERFNGNMLEDIKGFWILSPALVNHCSGHKWKQA